MADSPRADSTLVSPLYVVCDDAVCGAAGWSLLDFASACLDGGARLLQLRIKAAPANTFTATAVDLVARAERYGATVIVNDRADVALIAGAAGVHVGQDDLSPADIRRLLGPTAIVGFSTHSDVQIASALDEPVSYLAIGPVFDTATKNTGYSEVGLGLVRSASKAAANRRIPVVAIGGITLERAPAVVREGAQAVAVISDLFIGGDPARRVRQFLDALESARG